MLNKRAELQAQIEIHDPDVIAITEVSPKNSRYTIQPSEVAIAGYELFHTLDRNARGIVLLIRENLSPSVCEDLISDFEESLFVNCKLSSGEKLTIGLVYRRGKSTSENNDKLNELITKAADPKRENLLILGDFNFPEIDWQMETSNCDVNHAASKFLKVCKDSFLYQMQKEATRSRIGQRSNVLDLVLTNREDLISEMSTECGLGKSDHHAIIVKVMLCVKPTEKDPRYNFMKANFEEINKELGSVNWESEFEGLNTNETWNNLKEKIFSAMENNVPKTKPCGKKHKKWMDRGTLRTVRKKHQLFRRWLQTRDGQIYQEYIKARNRASKECKKTKKRMELKVASEAKTKPKGVWSYVNSKVKSKSGVADLQKEDGSKTVNDYEKAEVLNSFFKSVFTTEENGEMPEPPVYNFESELSYIDIYEEKVRKLLANQNTNKAPGPDKNSSLLLSKASDTLAMPTSCCSESL